MPAKPRAGRVKRTDPNGQTYIFDVDELLWPEGLWMLVCAVCLGGPLSSGQTYCGDFNNIAPGKCIKEHK